MKRLISMLLAIFLLAATLPMAAAATTIVFPVNNNCKIGFYYGNTSDYGGKHSGIDIHASNDDSIYAAVSGKVVATANSCFHSSYGKKCEHWKTYGNYIQIKGDDDRFYYYGHLLQYTLVVKTGDRVKAGQKIARMGSSGYSTGKHLHFEVRDSSNKTINVNPASGNYPHKGTTFSYKNGPYSKAKVLTFIYNTNGGKLTVKEYTASKSGNINKNGRLFMGNWALGTGGDKYGLANAATFGLTRDNYRFVGWSLSKDGSSRIFDQDDTSLKAETIYPKVKDGAATVTLYAIWEFLGYDLKCCYNDSGKNYLYGSDFTGTLNPDWWQSRDTTVATISADSTEQHNGNSSLKIVNTTAGASGKDLAFQTLTQGSQKNNGFVGDNKPMTLSFWAKSSTAGTRMFFRWGFESDFRSVTLTTDWQKYTVPMNKTSACNAWMHPYVDSAGTVWLSEIQLEDGTEATDFIPETGGLYTSVKQLTNNHTLPDPPVRNGYTFDGWYTAASGGEQITASTPATHTHNVVYAHWTSVAHDYTSHVTAPTCTQEGYTTYTCRTCGNSYIDDRIPPLGHSYYTSHVIDPTCTQEGYTSYTCRTCGSNYTDDRIPPLGHSYVNGVCTRCGTTEIGLQGTLDALLSNTATTPADIQDALSEMETEELLDAMYEDNGSVPETLASLDEKMGVMTAVDAAAENTLGIQSGDDVTAIGAALNAANPDETVTLRIGPAASSALPDDIYDSAKSLPFSMELTNALPVLAVPVQITLPVPDAIDPDKLVILRHADNGTTETVPCTIIYKDGKPFAAFCVSCFGDFTMTESLHGVTLGRLTVDKNGTGGIKVTRAQDSAEPVTLMVVSYDEAGKLLELQMFSDVSTETVSFRLATGQTFKAFALTDGAWSPVTLAVERGKSNP